MIGALTFYLIDLFFNNFTNRADPDKAALVKLIRASRSGLTLFAYGNMIRYDPTLVNLRSNFFVLCLFDLHPINNLSVKQGRIFLG